MLFNPRVLQTPTSLMKSTRFLSSTTRATKNFHRPDKIASSDPSEAADATATILSDTLFNKDHKVKPEDPEVDSRPNKAFWWDALVERNKRLAEGKTIDSYAYQSVRTNQILQKTREDSFSYLTLPFKDDEVLRDEYINSAGRLRMGQLFQDLDALAGRIGYRHCAPAQPINVTASVDSIQLLKKVDEIHKYNFIIAGFVSWTGRSSMEISVKGYNFEDTLNEEITLDYLTEQKKNLFLSANFTFVARNPETHKSHAINHLLPTTQEEWIDFKRAESHNAAKKLKAKMESLDRQPPTSSESNMIHNMYIASKKLKDLDEVPQNITFMSDTVISSTLFMQPQYRNRHSYMIFGGYLLRQTFELAYCAAGSFSRANPRFVALDTTTFKAPVPVGSVLFMDASICYTEHIHESKEEVCESAELLNQFMPNREQAANKLSPDEKEFFHSPGTIVQVKVSTKIRSLDTKKLIESGTFVYSFLVPRDAAGEFDQPGYSSVVPESYSEMMDFLEGRRRAIETAQNAQQFKEEIANEESLKF